MPSVLIAGHGYLGAAAGVLFCESGWSVEGWTGSVASANQTTDANYVVRAVDIRKKDEIPRVTAGFDVVIHSASTRGGEIDDYRRLYLDGARNLLERFPDSRFLLIGSTSVYGQKKGELVTEADASEPEHERGKILRDTEQTVVESGGSVARLSGIYGPGRSYLLQRFLAGEAVIDSECDRFVNQIHRDDAVSAVLLLAKISESAGQIFNVTDDEPIPQSECYRWLAERLNRPVPPSGESASSGKRGRSNKRVSNAKLRALGWSLKFPTFAEAMEKSILPSFGL